MAAALFLWIQCYLRSCKLIEDSDPLKGITIAVPETRELKVFSDMIEKTGAKAFHCPLVAIKDSPHEKEVTQWIQRFIDEKFHDLILFTGEGLRRLMAFAERSGLREQFLENLTQVRKITRGPKPARALRMVGLNTDLPVKNPTTGGIIDELKELNLQGRTIGVQLYPDGNHSKLIRFLEDANATPILVFPYVYDSAIEDKQVENLIKKLARGEINVIAFTSAPQVRRLIAIAKKGKLDHDLRHGLSKTKVAAIGPVVADSLKKIGIGIDIQPKSRFFMKPLLREIITHCKRLILKKED